MREERSDLIALAEQDNFMVVFAQGTSFDEDSTLVSAQTGASVWIAVHCCGGGGRIMNRIIVNLFAAILFSLVNQPASAQGIAPDIEYAQLETICLKLDVSWGITTAW
jgi:hypothetical protein